MKTAVAIFILISIVSLGGTLLPQEKADALIYKSAWFGLLLVFLAISTTFCLIRRLPVTKENVFSLLSHAAVPVILAGALAGFIAGKKGFVYINEGEETRHAHVNDSAVFEMPFSIMLKDFRIERHEIKTAHAIAAYKAGGKKEGEFAFEKPGIIDTGKAGLNIEIKRMFRDFVLAERGKPSDRSENWNNPAVLIKSGGDEGWLFARYPDFHGERAWDGYLLRYMFSIKGGSPKSYESDIVIVEGGKEKAAKTIGVNYPLDYKGWSVYQHSYDEENPEWTALMVKKDPGVWVVYLGFLMLTAGLFGILYKKTKGGNK